MNLTTQCPSVRECPGSVRPDSASDPYEKRAIKEMAQAPENA